MKRSPETRVNVIENNNGSRFNTLMHEIEEDLNDEEITTGGNITQLVDGRKGKKSGDK